MATPPGGPDLPPRPRGKPPGSPGVAKPSAPVPAPRGSKVSDLAKSFQGSSSSNGPPLPSGRPSAPFQKPPAPPNSDTVPSTPPALPSRRVIDRSSSNPPPPLPTSSRPSLPSMPVPPSPAPDEPPELPPSLPPSLPSSRRGAPSTAEPPELPPTLPPSLPNSRRGGSETKSVSSSISASASTDGFGACLQNCYETISKRHEDELLALESLRNHVFARSRLDKDYSESLAKMNMKASRKMNSVGTKSSILQAWLSFLELSDTVQKHVSNGAAQMSGILLHAVDQLIRDKRSAKSAFDQERARMDGDCNSSCKTAQDLRRSYQGYAKLTETNKKKLVAALDKDPPKLADQEKYRKKFVHNAEKLHCCHNEYSLAITNANIHIEHHRSSLLPFCLDTLQQRMELQITEWKDAMMNYAVAMDLTKVYEEQFQHLYNSLKQVEQDQEYVEFIRENRKEQPPVEYYEFDNNLLTEPSAPQVEPGRIVVNNLTYQPMKIRLSILESEVEQHTKEMETKENDLKELMCTSDEVMSPSSPNKDPQQKLPKHVREAILKARLKELDCLVARKLDQMKLIQEATDNVNEDEVPLFDELGEGVDPKDLDMSQALAAGSSGVTTKKRGMSLGSKLSTISRGFGKIKGKFKMQHSSLSSTPENSVVPSSSPSMDFNSEDGLDDSDDEASYDQPPELPVEEEDWYYGDIDRKVAESKCKTSGDYIVRYSERQAKYVLTCNWNGQGKHFVIQQLSDEHGQKMFRFESKSFATIRSLLEFHISTGSAVTKASQAKILKPVPKHDKWSLSHNDVKIGKKIGKGAFGDVFDAQLNGEKVAVKTCRSSDLADMDKFMMEADILKQYQHPNVVRLLGVCADQDPVYIVMEFMPGGALLDFLRKKGSQQSKKKLCMMCIDACRGMAYLESQHCIHRDLAARNCLVGDDDAIKISDFGMSREDEGGIYIVSSGTRQIPIKWTAPEALNYGKYSSPSDVWSFGIMLWEVYSCGSAPYPGMSNHEARSQIEVGYRMPAPADTPDEVSGVMQSCWQYDPEERPDFATLLDMLIKACSTIRS